MGYPLPSGAAFNGPFAPMRFEATVEECIVSQGEVPKELAGGFYRTGPTWKRPTRQGPNPLLSMDGMVQGLVFDNGRVDFRNRWIRTPKYLLEDKHQEGKFEWLDSGFGDWRDFAYGDVRRDSFTRGVPQGTNNINIVPFGDDVVALSEQGGPPIALDPFTLETKGIVSWSPKLSTGIHKPTAFGDADLAAHPKWDAETGILYGWNYRDVPPYVTIHIIHPDGTVESRDLEDAPYNTVAHDIWLTPEWMVMPFQPFLISQQQVIDRQVGIWAWDESLPVVLALIPRHDIHGDIRWISTDLPPQYVMHTLSANVDGDILTLDAPIFDRPPFPFEQDLAIGDDVALFFSVARSFLGRWTINLTTGKASAEQLSDRPSELPKVDERFYGRNYEFGFQVGGDVKRKGMSMNSLVMTNMRTLKEQVYQIRSGQPAAVLEGTFAPRTPDAAEGDGYIIVPVSWWAEKRGQYLIFDTYDITRGPVCTIDLPFALGWTPHGHWKDFRESH
ncbi:carotenoid oxygenase family protein [Rhodococcus erythropolis]|uniref:carotenoid oxygenase family protein n=1 Tax=Rhodococcus erythropolis TaxID=1833 RepID=UPI0024B75731|nr:carotenoid oxygenase family protein [Rhodococcus erythropolis]MDJ0015486.1 carotenoid oxygenase family protein [Rhodococcus erythropolis]